MATVIRVGIGGWVFEPWRGVFYPKGLPQARELDHASRQLTTIEINGTFYGSQKPESFRRWAAETPDDFVFSLKAPRFATHRRVLAEAGPSIERFFGSGVLRVEAQARPDPVAVRAHQGVRPRRLRGVPGVAAAERSTGARSAMWSRCGTRASSTPAFIALLRKHCGRAGAGRVRQASR